MHLQTVRTQMSKRLRERMRYSCILVQILLQANTNGDKLQMKDEILKLASECMEEDEIKQAFKNAFTNAVRDCIENAFRWGDIKKLLDKKIKETMLPYLENYDYSDYLVKLDTVLVDILNSPNIVTNKEILSNFKALSEFKIPFEITATEIFEKWMDWASHAIDTSELEVDTDDEPSYYPQECEYIFRENNKESWFSSYNKGYLHFSCESDDDLTVSVPVRRWGNEGCWELDIDSSEINLESLRRLDSFKLFLLQMKQHFTRIIIDKEEETDEFEVYETPECSWS